MRPVEIRDLNEDFEAARNQVEAFLHRRLISDVVIYETMLIFEAICNNIYEQCGDEPPVVTVTGRRRFGNAGIIINYEGGMYVSERDEAGDPTPEEMILNAYGDRIDYTYRSRFNSIRIQARRSYVGSSVAYMIAVLLAIIVYLALDATAGVETETMLRNNIVFPLETLFANAMMMIGAPVTFLSLLKNLTGTYILSERDSGIRKMTRQTLMSSATSVLMAIATAYAIFAIIPDSALGLKGYGDLSLRIGLGDFITELMPSDILTPFQTVSPFPLILLAGLVTYAFCSVGKYFDKMMSAIDVCYALFSRMLTIIMSALPFFAFCAVLDLLLVSGTSALLYCGRYILIVLVSTIVPMVYYALRLGARRLSIPGFTRRLIPLLKENFKIASVIDAVPYNIRYCIKNYGLDRKKLEAWMPVLAQVNLDGNCYVITLIGLLFVMFSGSGVPFGEMLMIGVLVFVLSLGAPNQPGSLVIGMLIILHYVRAYTFIPLAIFAEIFFGAILNLMNVTGDVVTVVIDEKPDLSGNAE